MQQLHMLPPGNAGYAPLPLDSGDSMTMQLRRHCRFHLNSSKNTAMWEDIVDVRCYCCVTTTTTMTMLSQHLDNDEWSPDR